MGQKCAVRQEYVQKKKNNSMYRKTRNGTGSVSVPFF